VNTWLTFFSTGCTKHSTSVQLVHILLYWLYPALCQCADSPHPYFLAVLYTIPVYKQFTSFYTNCTLLYFTSVQPVLIILYLLYSKLCQCSASSNPSVLAVLYTIQVYTQLITFCSGCTLHCTSVQQSCIHIFANSLQSITGHGNCV